MLQSQKRQVREFLSSGEIDNEPYYGLNNRVPFNHHPDMTKNALAPPALDYNMLTASAPAERHSTYSEENPINSEGTVDKGRISSFPCHTFV